LSPVNSRHEEVRLGISFRERFHEYQFGFALGMLNLKQRRVANGD
jgi:hypothetical protein